jgi:hypothetical protein
MGLLDDAIREHLELRRLRGADPSEVIHEEREAFGLVAPEVGATPPEQVVDSESPAAGEDGASVEAEAHGGQDLSHLGQETMELDMRTVIEGDLTEHTDRAKLDILPPVMGAAPSRARVENSVPRERSMADPLEWEVPKERDHDFRGLREDEPTRRGRIVDVR